MTQQTGGGSTSSEEALMTRLQLYGVYESQDELQKEMESYNIETTTRAADVESSTMEDEDDFLAWNSVHGTTMTSGIDPNPMASGGETSNSIATRQQTSADRDVWGRFALKEAKEPILCPMCTRPITTSRFAMHLDKCMGIGTTVRSAAAGAGTTSTRSAAGSHTF